MSNISDRERYERLNNCIYWKRSKVDSKGRAVLPHQLRAKLGVREGSEILWIQCIKKDGKENEFTIEIGVQR
jgi:hypothetical protein